MLCDCSQGCNGIRYIRDCAKTVRKIILDRRNTTPVQHCHTSRPIPFAMTLPIETATNLSTEMPRRADAVSWDVASTSPWLHSSLSTRYTLPKLLLGTTFASLLLHGGMLLIPLPESQPIADPTSNQQTQTVALTSLPVPTVPTPTTPNPPAPQPVSIPVPQTPTTATGRSPLTSFTPPRVATPTQRNTTKTQPQTTAVTPKQTKPQPKTRQTTAPQTPKPTSPTKPLTPPPSPPTDPWQDFPTYPNAQAGCFARPACLQTNADLSTVTAFFEQELAAKNYQLKSIINDTDEKIYQVSRGKRTEFLSVLLTPDQGAGYLLSIKPINLALLRSPETADSHADDDRSLNIAVGCQHFVQPDLFCDHNAKRPEIETVEWVEGGDLETLFDYNYRFVFENNGYEINQLSPYGTGPMYAISKNNQTQYINIVPNRNKTGAIIVTWSALPATISATN